MHIAYMYIFTYFTIFHDHSSDHCGVKCNFSCFIANGQGRRFLFFVGVAHYSMESRGGC